MREIFIASALCILGAGLSYANDTTAISCGKIERVISDTTINSKGKKCVKTYFLVDGVLMQTTKQVADYYRLTVKYSAKCDLYVVTSKSGKRKIIHK